MPAVALERVACRRRVPATLPVLGLGNVSSVISPKRARPEKTSRMPSSFWPVHGSSSTRSRSRCRALRVEVEERRGPRRPVLVRRRARAGVVRADGAAVGVDAVPVEVVVVVVRLARAGEAVLGHELGAVALEVLAAEGAGLEAAGEHRDQRGPAVASTSRWRSTRGSRSSVAGDEALRARGRVRALRRHLRLAVGSVGSGGIRYSMDPDVSRSSSTFGRCGERSACAERAARREDGERRAAEARRIR